MKISEKFDLTGKVALVTGASKGIGQAIALAFGQQGAKVVISSRKQEACDEVAAEFAAQGLEAFPVACHMGSEEQIAQMVQKIQEKYGQLDIVVNNAATNPVFGPLHKAPGEAFDKIMEVNVKGPWLLNNLAYPLLKVNGGSIINISSIEGITPGQGLGLYSVSKSALISLTKASAREWGKSNIRVNVICPGLVRTKFSEALTSNDQILQHVLGKQALPQVAEPIDMAGLALFLASNASSFCTGGVYVADGGYVI
ncbi:MAG: glucose 1-dehydrogenase [Bacteroidia bacterium]|nr:glucose 1-dehydrogenase [Bacteroidia bacterium]